LQEIDTQKQLNAYLKKNFDKIFINELDTWLTDEDDYPEKRTYKMFTDFFEVVFHNMVLDLEKEPVIKEDLFM
jgi:hypothetical protein